MNFITFFVFNLSIICASAQTLSPTTPYQNSTTSPTTNDPFILSRGSSLTLAPKYTTVVITSCSNNICTKTSSKALLSSYTTTSVGIKSVVTTYCTLTDESVKHTSTPPDILRTERPIASKTFSRKSSERTEASLGSTTKVTITSCSEEGCKVLTTSALVSYVTSSKNGLETIYTTYCPLTGTHLTGSTESQFKTVTSCESCVTITSSSLATTFTSSTKTTSIGKTSTNSESNTDRTRLITVTSCSRDSCTTSVSPILILYVTSSTNGLETIYTTYCPLTETQLTESSSKTSIKSLTQGTSVTTCVTCAVDTTAVTEALTFSRTSQQQKSRSSIDQTPYTSTSTQITTITAVVKQPQTTSIWIESCHNGLCKSVQSAALVQLKTATSQEVLSIYTTYCPLSSTEKVLDLPSITTEAGAIEPSQTWNDTPDETAIIDSTEESTILLQSISPIMPTSVITYRVTTAAESSLIITSSVSATTTPLVSELIGQANREESLRYSLIFSCLSLLISFFI